MCLLLTSSILLQKFNPLKIFAIACILFFLFISVEITLFHYIQSFNDRTRTIEALRFLNFIYDNPYTVKYGPYMAWFAIQTFLLALFLKAPVGKTLTISSVACVTTCLVVYLSWKYVLSDTTKLELMLHITQDLGKIYLPAQYPELFNAIQELQKYLSEKQAGQWF